MKVQQWIIIALLTGSLVACTNSSDDNPQPDNLTVILQNNASWRVSYFFDKDKEETGDFASYRFVFREDGVLEAIGSTATILGTWKVIQDDGVRKMAISLNAGKPLSELADDWVIIEQSAGRIILQDDNDEHLEELHFVPV